MVRITPQLATLLLAPLALANTVPGPAAAAKPVQTTSNAEERLPHISVVTMGSKGSAVILIPGLATPRAVWDGIAPKLAQTHRVYLVQVNGFGGDDAGANLAPPLLDGIAADIDSYIRAHNIKDAAIIGHSIGGLLAMMMGTRYPQDTGRVMVVDALPFFSLLFGEGVTAESARPFAEQARARVIATPQPTAPVASDPGGIWSITPTGRIQVANWAAKAESHVAGQAMYEAMTTDWRPELAKLKGKPFTVLYATGAGPRAQAIWESAYAGSSAKLVPIADSWHFIMLDQPAAFDAAVTAFLAQP